MEIRLQVAHRGYKRKVDEKNSQENQTLLGNGSINFSYGGESQVIHKTKNKANVLPHTNLVE